MSFSLFSSLSQLLKRREVAVPLQIEQLSVELEAWRACTYALMSVPQYITLIHNSQRLCFKVSISKHCTLFQTVCKVMLP